MRAEVLTELVTQSQGGPVIEGPRTAEVRWILPGQLDAALVRWFGRFPAGMDSREDAYLVDPLLHGLSVKIRAGRRFEVKVRDSSPGILDVADRVRGRIEAWRKWSFPIGLLKLDDAGSPSWAVVHKRRWTIRFQLVSGRPTAEAPELTGESACGVDLTEVRSGGATWWSLGFEATGPATLLSGTLRRTAALLFAETPPGDPEFDMSHSQSYVEWLSRLPLPSHRGWPDPARGGHGRAAGRGAGDPGHGTVRAVARVPAGRNARMPLSVVWAPKNPEPLGFGAGRSSRDRTRTYNLPVNSRTLCRLSYAGPSRISVAHRTGCPYAPECMTAGVPGKMEATMPCTGRGARCGTRPHSCWASRPASSPARAPAGSGTTRS